MWDELIEYYIQVGELLGKVRVLMASKTINKKNNFGIWFPIFHPESLHMWNEELKRIRKQRNKAHIMDQACPELACHPPLRLAGDEYTPVVEEFTSKNIAEAMTQIRKQERDQRRVLKYEKFSQSRTSYKKKLSPSLTNKATMSYRRADSLNPSDGPLLDPRKLIPKCVFLYRSRYHGVDIIDRRMERIRPRHRQTRWFTAVIFGLFRFMLNNAYSLFDTTFPEELSFDEFISCV